MTVTTDTTTTAAVAALTVADTAKRIIQIRCGGKVERCHVLPHQGSYNNAAHSWGVAMLMHALWPEDFERLALVCLTHDVAEAWVGDIPSPLLYYLPKLRDAVGNIEGDIVASLDLPREDQLAPDDYAKLKACDRLELYLWCREQKAIGNGFAGEFLTELKIYFTEKRLYYPADMLFSAFEKTSILPKQAGIIKAIGEKDHG